MPRQTATKQFNAFSAGLNTEASPLSFPEQTAKDLDNLDLRRDGSLKRRLGLDFETGGAHSTTTFPDSTLKNDAISYGEWRSVEGDDNINWFVLQVGTTLYIHNLGADPISQDIIGSIDLDNFKTHVDMRLNPMDFAHGKGKLFVVNRFMSPVFIDYDVETDTFTGQKITVKIRDTDGLDEDDPSPILTGNITPTTTDSDDDNQNTF